MPLDFSSAFHHPKCRAGNGDKRPTMANDTGNKICKNVKFVETKNKNRTRFGVCPHTTRKQVLFYYNKESIPLAPNYRLLSISHQTAVHSVSHIKRPSTRHHAPNYLPLGILTPAEVQSLPAQPLPSPVTAIIAKSSHRNHCQAQSPPAQPLPSSVTAITASTVIAKFSLCPRPCLRQKLYW